MKMERMSRLGYKKLKLIYFLLILFVFLSFLAYYFLTIYNYDDNFFENSFKFGDELQSRLASIEKNIASNRLILQSVRNKIEGISQALSKYTNGINKWNLTLSNFCNQSGKYTSVR